MGDDSIGQGAEDASPTPGEPESPDLLPGLRSAIRSTSGRMARTRGFHGRSRIGRAFSRAWRAGLLAVIVAPITACVGAGDGGRSLSWNSKADQLIPLPGAEQTDRRSRSHHDGLWDHQRQDPDVWGQDRLSKFRSEYEAEMSEWLKSDFKGDINASVRRSETEATTSRSGRTSAGHPPRTRTSRHRRTTPRSPR